MGQGGKEEGALLSQCALLRGVACAMAWQVFKAGSDSYGSSEHLLPAGL